MAIFNGMINRLSCWKQLFWKSYCKIYLRSRKADQLREKCPNIEFSLVRIQSEYGKIRTRKNSVFGHFSGCEFYQLCLFMYALILHLTLFGIIDIWFINIDFWSYLSLFCKNSIFQMKVYFATLHYRITFIVPWLLIVFRDFWGGHTY